MTQHRKPPRIRLTARDRDIIEHVVRDRISTNEVIQHRFFDRAHATSVTRTTARLCAAGWLSAFPLIYPTNYFIPGKLAASAYGLPVGRTYPLGPQALPSEYAVLEYTAASASQVRRLYVEELQTQVPWYRPEWMLAPHCRRDADEKTTLELIRVDLGGPPDHIARKCRRDVGLRREATEFDELVARGEFSLVILTGSTNKAAAIQTALDQHLWPEPLSFRIAVFMSLIPLLPRSL
jgi:hypothetical protein